MLSSKEVKINLKSQLDEIEMLQSIYSNAGEFRLGDPNAIDVIKQFLTTNNEEEESSTTEIPPSIDFDIRLTINEAKFEVRVQLSHEYPSKEDSARIFVSSSRLNKHKHSSINNNLKEFLSDRWKTFNSPIVFDALAWIQENVDYYVERDEQVEKIIEEKKKLTRMWMYSHHIYSRSKRKEMQDTANKLNLTGFCLPGKPGIVCVEGIEEDCNEWWQYVRNMGWKKMFVKIQEKDVERKFDRFDEVVFDNANLKCQHMDLGEFSKFLKKKDCAHAFKQLFGIEINSSNNEK